MCQYCLFNSWSKKAQPIKKDLNKKLLPMQKTIGIFHIDKDLPIFTTGKFPSADFFTFCKKQPLVT